MNFELVLLQQLSGNHAGIYTVKKAGAKLNLLEQFISDCQKTFPTEVADILARLNTIGKKTGAREDYFKQNEGRPGDGVCALYDKPDSNLRLYCIHYGKGLIVVGNGGQKPKGISAWQEVPLLKAIVPELMKISAAIAKAQQEGSLRIDKDGYDFEGDLSISYDEDE